MKKVLLFLIVGIIFLVGCSDNEDVEVNTKDYYEMVTMNIINDDETLLWASNSNARTLGAAIDEENKYEDFFQLKETSEGRIIESYQDTKNKGDNQWMIFSESCGETQICDTNVDSIILDEELEFIIIYEDVTAQNG